MAKVVKKPVAKVATKKSAVVKPMTKKAAPKKVVKPEAKCKCGKKCPCTTKVQKVSVKSVKTQAPVVKKSVWKKIAEFLGF